MNKEELHHFLTSPFLERQRPKLYCPQCGSEIEPSEEFCECGKLLLVEEDYDAVSDEMDLEDEGE